MKFFLEPNFQKLPIELKHADPILLWGSCFSDELADNFSQAGFQLQSNLLGTVFHPLAIIKQFNCLLDNSFDSFFESNKRWYSWDASHSIHFDDEQTCRDFLKLMHATFLESISKKNCTLIITLGSAWGYQLKSATSLVSNCHKQPSQLFDKVFSSPEEIATAYGVFLSRLKQINPTIRICFTVSPVRHVRDGLIENNQSKASLIESIRQIQQQFPEVVYIPTYELVIDVLRDYRFYKADLIHPNAQAIQFVWDYLKQHVMSIETVKLTDEAERLAAYKRHLPSDMSQESMQQRNQKLQAWVHELTQKGLHVTL